MKNKSSSSVLLKLNFSSIAIKMNKLLKNSSYSKIGANLLPLTMKIQWSKLNGAKEVTWKDTANMSTSFSKISKKKISLKSSMKKLSAMTILSPFGLSTTKSRKTRPKEKAKSPSWENWHYLSSTLPQIFKWTKHFTLKKCCLAKENSGQKTLWEFDHDPPIFIIHHLQNINKSFFKFVKILCCLYYFLIVSWVVIIKLNHIFV